MSDSCPLDISECTVATCSIECARVKFLPSLGGNAFFAVVFGILLICQIGFGIRHRTWGFMVGMIFGLFLEVVGYAGRIMLHNNPFDFNNFLIYLIPLTIGPAFITGSMYLCLSRIIIVQGANISRLSPRTYSIVFMFSDFFSLVLQGAGGGIAATASTRKGSDMGRHIMIAGLIFQVISLFLFMCLWAEFIIKARKTPEAEKSQEFAAVRSGRWQFNAFTYMLWLATICIFTRSVYRVAELWEGFTGPVASNETAFMILEGPMIILAVLALTIIHPGLAFGGAWKSASWSLRSKKSTKDSFEFQQVYGKSDA